MRQFVIQLALLAAGLLALAAPSGAHFGCIIPSDDIVGPGDEKTLRLDVRFMHPFEGHGLEMARPRAFFVLRRGERTDLLPGLRERRAGGAAAWLSEYRVRRPGDHVFCLEPEPYFEPAEDTFIVHYTKVVVSALGLEEGWDRPAGLPVEIVPLTRPYGLWAGNVFQGVVTRGGQPVAHATVEVEYLNEGSAVRAPADPYITQVVKADGDGVFTYALPRAGWWGFAALMDAGQTLVREGREYPVELGAVLWVRCREMR